MPSRAIRSMRFALGEQLRHPWRTLLVSQGMIWAVALTLIPAAVIDGTRKDATERAAELGTDLIQVATDGSLEKPQAVRESDLEPLRGALPEGAVVSGLRVRPAPFEHPGLPRGEVWLLGADEYVVRGRGKEIVAGEFPQLGGDNPAEGAIEVTLATLLFGSVEAALGQTLTLGPLTFLPEKEHREIQIVGVVEDETSGGPDPFGGNNEKAAYALAKRLMRALGIAPDAAPWREQGVAVYVPRATIPGDEIDWLYVRVAPLEVAEEAKRLEGFLAGRGCTPLIYTNALWPVLTSPELNGYMTLHKVFFALFLGMGLAVLTNLLLLSGWQRRYEIALRRAEGASRGDIFGQFLCEGIVVAIVGWTLGIICGIGLAEVRAALDPFTIMTVGWPWGEIFRSGGILGLGAIVASAYPAWRASSYHPMSLFRRS